MQPHTLKTLFAMRAEAKEALMIYHSYGNNRMIDLTADQIAEINGEIAIRLFFGFLKASVEILSIGGLLVVACVLGVAAVIALN